MSEVLEIECLRLASDGSGVGYAEGKATFVPGLLPGERGRVEVTEKKKRWQRAKLLFIENEADERVNPPCRVFETCGGCQLQHLAYDETLKWKERWVVDVLKRIGKVDMKQVEVRPTLGMDEPWRYRNKARLHWSPSGELGYYQEKSRSTVEFPDCLLISESMNEWVRKVRGVLGKISVSAGSPMKSFNNGFREIGSDRSVVLELFHHSALTLHQVVSDSTEKKAFVILKELQDWASSVKNVTFRENTQGEGMLIFETSQKDFSSNIETFLRTLVEAWGLESKNETKSQIGLESKIQPESRIRSIWSVSPQGVPELWWGENFLTEQILGLTFKISPLAFLQVNPLQTRRLYTTALEWAEIEAESRVWDLYCGIGTITLALAKKAQFVWGIEENPYAVKDAWMNAELNHINNVEFLQGKVEDVLTKVREKPDVVIMDPPRAGVHRRVLDRLIEVNPERIVYVSCDPGTLARDVGILQEAGYRVKKVQPVDMFPWTQHVECVTLMSKVEK